MDLPFIRDVILIAVIVVCVLALGQLAMDKLLRK